MFEENSVSLAWWRLARPLRGKNISTVRSSLVFYDIMVASEQDSPEIVTRARWTTTSFFFFFCLRNDHWKEKVYKTSRELSKGGKLPVELVKVNGMQTNSKARLWWDWKRGNNKNRTKRASNRVKDAGAEFVYIFILQGYFFTRTFPPSVFFLFLTFLVYMNV